MPKCARNAITSAAPVVIAIIRARTKIGAAIA
jgi:hypothetical protein